MIRINDNGVKYCDVCNISHDVLPYLDENGNCLYCKERNIDEKNTFKIEDYEDTFQSTLEELNENLTKLGYPETPTKNSIPQNIEELCVLINKFYMSKRLYNYFMFKGGMSIREHFCKIIKDKDKEIETLNKSIEFYKKEISDFDNKLSKERLKQKRLNK